MPSGLGPQLTVLRRAQLLTGCLAVTGSSGAFTRPPGDQRLMLAVALALAIASWAAAQRRARRAAAPSGAGAHLAEALLAAAVLATLLLVVDLSHADETPWDLAGVRQDVATSLPR